MTAIAATIGRRTLGMSDIKRELAEVAAMAEAVENDQPVRRVRNKRPARNPSQVYSIRIPVDRLEELRSLASGRGAAPTALMREWVLERLDAEVGHSPYRVAVPVSRPVVTVLDERRAAAGRDAVFIKRKAGFVSVAGGSGKFVKARALRHEAFG
jgi:hypothetical protein